MNYHSPEDTADRLVDRRMAGVVDGVFNAIVRLADKGWTCPGNRF